MIRNPLSPFLATAALAFGAWAVPQEAAAQGVFVPPPGQDAGAPLEGKRARLARELQRFGFGSVDVRRLSNQQVAVLSNLVHADGSHGDVAQRIRGVLRPGIITRTINNR